MYHILPSQVVEQATTFDLMVYDVMMAWEDYQENRNKGIAPQNVDQNVLEEIIRRHR